MKIRGKFFLTIWAVILPIIIGIYGFSKFFLEDIYISKKKEALLYVGDIINSPSNISSLEEIEEQESVTITLKKNNIDSLSEDLSESLKENLVEEDTLTKLASGENILVDGALLNHEENFLFLYMPYIGDNILEIRTPLAPIKESVYLANKYYFQIVIIAGLFGILLSFIFSRKTIKPILRLIKTTENISKLNFDEKIEYQSNDELRDLGNSLNKMQDLLKDFIFELNEKNKALEESLEIERKIKSSKKGFITGVSHELKTPIAIIQGYAEGLRHGIANEKDRDFYCQVIEEECLRIDTLVKDMLLMFKVDSGHLTFNNEIFSLNNVIKTTLDRLETLDSSIISTFSEEDIYVFGDVKYIQLVLSNLIGNAFKYADVVDGRKEVEVSYVEDREGRVKVFVKNYSKDITSEELEKCWDPFHRSDKSRNSEGSGIGLNIVRGILSELNLDYGGFVEGGIVSFFFEIKRVQKIKV